MSETEIKAILSKINWDTPLSNDDLFRIFSGSTEKKGGIDRDWIYTRILNTFNWYTVLKIIPKDQLPFLLSDRVINNLFPRQLRNKYRHVRSALFE
ncbi:MAG: hypothetical protein IT214_07260 [Chitinophagaceae bacterium]|jgi:hypothetical protein|nr:hypothetical protein [Chitinophagaceae bacterium]OQY96559.1 MAG: hypothetical protein B6D37_01640 [Sphingobacteriales bacterium UTBCD1]